jgi:hypothetical protein
LALYRRWRAYRAWLNTPEARTGDDDAFDALVECCTPMEEEMNRLPAQNMTDLAAKVLCLSGNGEWALPEGPEGIIGECKALLRQAGLDPILNRKMNL